MFENTTRLQATDETNILQDLKTQQDFQQPGHLSHWSNHICGNVWKYRKIAGHGGKLKILKPPKYHQICGNVWKYHKMAGHGGKFNLLKQPNTWQCLKIPHDSRTQDCQQRKNIELIANIRYVAMLKNSAMFENTDERRKSWKYHKIFSHGAFDFWRYHKIASNGEKFNLFNLKPPTRQCLKIPQDCRPRGNT